MSKLAKALTAAAGNAGGESLYVEDVFSTYLYEGNGSTQTITNGIDLDGEGGLVWIKERGATANHYLFDTERGSSFNLRSNLTNAQQSTTWFTGFNSNGFGVQSSILNGSSDTLASWTFRKAEKFFDVVTYTGNGGVQNISHNLGAVPAVIIVKNTQSSYDWGVYTASTGNGSLLLLNSTSAAASPANQWNNTTPTDTVFTVGNTNTSNRSGQTYVAYLFASDAGGFGDDGSESIIKCGSYTGNGSTNGPEIDLGFEPQWLMVKNSTASSDWFLVDTMRGFTANTSDSYQRLRANLSDAEDGSNAFSINSTGFKLVNATFNPNVSGNSYIYIAIRRPMKTPESGTEVFTPYLPTVYEDPYWKSSFPVVDFALQRSNTGSAGNIIAIDRLRGSGVGLETNTTDSESGAAADPSNYISYLVLDKMYGFHVTITFSPATPDPAWMFKRATGFFDVVCDTRAFTYGTLNHNLKVIPELIIKKNRSRASTFWDVLPNVSPFDYRYVIYLNDTQSISGPSTSYWNSAPTDTVFGVNYGGDGSQNGDDFVYYLFATLAGISKVGSYTGTGADLNVDCGFSAGARFILIKRTDSTGDWYVWDSARGIVAGNDPYLLLNSTAAAVTNTDYIDPLSSGFTVTSSAPAALNASGGNYIFLAIA